MANQLTGKRAPGAEPLFETTWPVAIRQRARPWNLPLINAAAAAALIAGVAIRLWQAQLPSS
ncbi:MAG TPA: hypothetical protein VI172_18425, partial [Candidatus Dormibacteraeota bacterium]